MQSEYGILDAKFCYHASQQNIWAGLFMFLKSKVKWLLEIYSPTLEKGTCQCLNILVHMPWMLYVVSDFFIYTNCYRVIYYRHHNIRFIIIVNIGGNGIQISLTDICILLLLFFNRRKKGQGSQFDTSIFLHYLMWENIYCHLIEI